MFLLWLFIAFSLFGQCYQEDEAQGTTRQVGPTTYVRVTLATNETELVYDVKVERPTKLDKAHYAYPYTMDDKFIARQIDWKAGYHQNFPPYVTLYEAPTTDMYLYIFPPKHCDAVWLCFPTIINSSRIADTYHDFKAGQACDASLRFHPLEQMVYVQRRSGKSKNIEYNSYPYWSNVAEITYNEDSLGARTYFFQPFEGDFDGEDVSKTTRGARLEMTMGLTLMLLFTSSPYCNARVMRPFQGPLPSRRILFWADEDAALRTGTQSTDPPSMYFLSGSRMASEERKGIYQGSVSNAFDLPEKRAQAKAPTQLDCCPPTWEFEGFILPGEWIQEYKISYLKYKLHRLTDKAGCGNDGVTGEVVKLQSVLLETGSECEWVRICFDLAKDNTMCSDDVNTLAFIFVHGVFTPTDSDEARQIGLEFQNLDAIRINFIRGAKGLEIGYAFADHLTPSIRELMGLHIYDGQSPEKLQLTLVRAPKCEARLLNDLGSANLRYGSEYERQCLTISRCDCLV